MFCFFKGCWCHRVIRALTPSFATRLSSVLPRWDIASVGCGLAGGLAALARAAKRPELDVRLVEAGDVGGNHIWSFFDSDIARRDRWLVAPLVRHHWPAYDVRFPGRARTLRMGYKSVTGEALAGAVAARSEEHTSELQSLMRISYAVFCLKKKK